MASLLNLAFGNLRTARLVIETHKDDLAIRDCAYNCQQGVEKCIKYLLKENSVRYINTHDIGFLINKAVTNGIEIPNEVVEISSVLTSWESKARYNGNFSAEYEDAIHNLEIAEEFLKYVTELHTENKPD